MKYLDKALSSSPKGISGGRLKMSVTPSEPRRRTCPSARQRLSAVAPGLARLFRAARARGLEALTTETAALRTELAEAA
jgi:hypothetical protein